MPIGNNMFHHKNTVKPRHIKKVHNFDLLHSHSCYHRIKKGIIHHPSYLLKRNPHYTSNSLESSEIGVPYKQTLSLFQAHMSHVKIKHY